MTVQPIEPLPMRGLPGSLARSRWNAHRYAIDPVGITARLHHEFGDLCTLTQDDATSVFAFGPEHTKSVLTNGDDLHTVFEYVTPAVIRAARRGIGLLNLNGAPHREARQLMAPAFKTAPVLSHAERVQAMVIDEVGSWRVGEPLNLSAAMRRLTLRIACEVFFGVDLRDDPHHVGRLVERMLRLRFFAPGIRYFPFDVPGSPLRRLLGTIRELDGALEAIIHRRRDSGRAAGDVLQTLMNVTDPSGRRLSDDEVIGHLTTLVVAGHDTTSNSLVWLFLMLSQHPDVRNGVLEAASVGDAEEGPQGDAITHVINETLRLFPPGPVTSRFAVAPTRIGPQPVDRGTRVVTSKFVSHRDSSVFPDPLHFTPARWRDTRPGRYEYLPFGAGPHVCIGASFAVLEMRAVVTEVAKRFVLDARPGTVVDRDVGFLMSPRRNVVMVPRPVRSADHATTPLKGDIHDMVVLDQQKRNRLGWVA